MILDFDVVVIGSGVAGMTASLYLKRAGLTCCVLEKSAPGGQIIRTKRVENYPGFVKISGAELAQNIFNQIKVIGVVSKYGEVKEIKDYKDYKLIKTDNEEIKCRAVVIAAGRQPKKLEVENSKQFIGKGLSYCATCDGNFFKGMDVVVVGGSNTALREAMYLSSLCQKVTILNRRDFLRAEQELQNDIAKVKNIVVKYNTTIKKLVADETGKLSSIVVDSDDKEEVIQASGCFACVGYIPDTENFDRLIEVDGEGYIKVKEGNRTNIDKIYAAGDLVKKEAYQLLTAMSDAVIAADSCVKDLK